MELSLEAQRVLRELLRCYGTDPDVKRLAETAAVCWDRAEQAGATVQAEGLTLTNKRGTFVHPAVTVERTSRLAFMSAIRALRQRPLRDKLGRPSKSDAIARRFFPEDDEARSARTQKYLRPRGLAGGHDAQA